MNWPKIRVTLALAALLRERRLAFICTRRAGDPPPPRRYP